MNVRVSIRSSQRENKADMVRHLCICSIISFALVVLVKPQHSSPFQSFLCFHWKNLQRISQHNCYRLYFSEICHWAFSFLLLYVCLTGCVDMCFKLIFPHHSLLRAHSTCKQTRINLHLDRLDFFSSFENTGEPKCPAKCPV